MRRKASGSGAPARSLCAVLGGPDAIARPSMTDARKQLRRAAAAAEQKRRWAEAESESPLGRDRMLALLESVAEHVAEEGHTNSLDFTMAWCAKNGVDAAPVVAFLAAHGVSDDYSLLMSGDPYTLSGPTEDRRRWMPVERAVLEELIAFVDRRCRENGCDNSHRFTRRFLEERRLPVGRTEMALLAQGGGCDCEVVLNVEVDLVYPGGRPNKGMKLTKLSAAWLPEWTCRLMPAPCRIGRGHRFAAYPRCSADTGLVGRRTGRRQAWRFSGGCAAGLDAARRWFSSSTRSACGSLQSAVPSQAGARQG